MSEHLSDDALRELMTGARSGAALLAADDHLAACAACRARGEALSGAAAAGLRPAVGPPEPHLSDDDLQAFVDGALEPAARAAATRHRAACAVCAEQIRDLEAWIPARTRPWRLPLAAAAAVLLAVVGPSVWWLMRGAPGGAERLPGLASLAAAQQQQVRAALAAGVATPPPLVAELAGRPDVLMGPSPASAPFALVAPLGTAVVSDRPRFEWQPLAGADAYEVTVADEQLRPVASSGVLSGTSWTPAEALPRGRAYVWQVSARRGDATVVVPEAPAPAARFRVIEPAAAAQVGALRASHPTSHLLLGIVLLQAGAVDEARRELLRVAPEHPDAAVARRTLEAIDRPR